MTKVNLSKRLFFGLEAVAPWPEKWPSGRLLEDSSRHLTIAFLGEVQESDALLSSLASFPGFDLKVGITGKFNECLFLPKHHPHVVAWNFKADEENTLSLFHKQLKNWLKEKGFVTNGKEPFLPHVTLCRSPFILPQWKKHFIPLPGYLKDLHLYESLGHSQYASLWSYPLFLPFEEFEHTADRGFFIRADSFQKLFYHARAALSFAFPPLIKFWESHSPSLYSLEDVIGALNYLIAIADAEIGVPFKAVSFHGKFEKLPALYLWEMIIDV